MSAIVAKSRKVLQIFDEENNKLVDVHVRTITRTKSKEYGKHSAAMKIARENNDNDQLILLSAEMISMRVCEESKDVMEELLDRCIAVEQYPKVLNQIEELFKDKDEAEKKPDTQKLTPSSVSASEASTSISKESSTTETVSQMNSGETSSTSPAQGASTKE